jgi:hypothetical protein
MSATLYALVVLQGTTLTFSPGYTTAAECLQQYKGPYVSCFPYDPERTTWTAFFKTPGSGFGSIWNFPNESVCQSYVGALRPDVPAACRQLARPESCPVSCVAPVQPPAPRGSIPPKPPEVTPPPEPDPKPDPASLNPKPSDIQVGGKQYTKVAGLTWVERESTKPDSFADVSVGPNDLQSKDQPTPLPPKTARAEAPQRRERYAPQQYAQRSPEPFRALIDVVMLPFDFLSYPGRRDW